MNTANIPCQNHKIFLTNLRLVNERARVEPDIVDLIEAYAALQLKSNLPIDFYPPLPEKFKPDKYLHDFIKNNHSVDQRVINFLVAYYRRINAGRICCIFNTIHLAKIIETPLERLNTLTHSKWQAYHTFSIPKKDGSRRTILAPNPELKVMQRRILDRILNQIPLNKYAEGFRKKRSILSNAQHHVGKKIVIKFDIQDFFPTITSSRVFGMYLQLGYPRGVARLLADLATYKGRLPMGAPTSPAIANIICRRLDSRFAGLGKSRRFSYSRYADDMTFSSDQEAVASLIPLFRQIVREEGFSLNEKKIRIMRNGRLQKVTGLVVNEKPNLPRSEIKKLRAVLHNCATGSVRSQATIWAKREKGHHFGFAYTVDDFKQSLQAKISFVVMVNPAVGENLKKQFQAINWIS